MIHETISVIQLLEEKKIKNSDFIITENYHTRLGENIAKMLIDHKIWFHVS